MYAIRSKKTKKWVYGTDYRYHPFHQRTAHDRVLIFPDYEIAKLAFICRRCGKAYEIVPVIVEERKEE